MAAAARKGRLARKIARQPKRPTISPPSTGPIAAERAITAPNVPNTLPLRSGTTSNRNSAIVAGTTSAPPTAVTQRAALKRARFGLTSPATDPRANSPMPSHRVREWPTTSLRRPPGP